MLTSSQAAIGGSKDDILVSTKRDGIIYNGCRSHYIRRLKSDTLGFLGQMEPPHLDTVTGLCWLDGYLVSACKNSTLKLWDVSKKENRWMPMPAEPEVKATRKAPKVLRQNLTESMAFTADDAGEMRFWELDERSLKCLGGFPVSGMNDSSNIAPVHAAEWIPGNQHTVLCSSGDRNLLLYRLE